MCCKQKSTLSRFGFFLGLVALGALLVAFISGSWLYTKEPLTLEKVPVKTTITFRIGFWRVCPSIKKINNSIPLPLPACSLVKYSQWKLISTADLGISWTSLDLAQPFINKMRISSVLCSIAVILLVLAVFFCLLGHCNNDNKTITGCGLFILGGLSLACSLISFVSALSETLAEIYEYHTDNINSYSSGPDYNYRYGWCFHTAIAALILVYTSSAFSFVGYLERYASTDEMVCELVPGAERKLREHQLSAEYLMRHQSPHHHYHHHHHRHQYDQLGSDQQQEQQLQQQQQQQIPLEQYEINECGPLLNKTPPDVCTTNRCQEFAELSSAAALENLNYCVAGISSNSTTHHQHQQSLAGQTIPITIKNHNSTAPLSFSNIPVAKYGTMPHHNNSAILHQGFLGVSDLGSSSSNSSSGYCGKSKTLQHHHYHHSQSRGGKIPSATKKCVKIESFQVPETDFEGFGKPSSLNNRSTNNPLVYSSGSAV